MNGYTGIKQASNEALVLSEDPYFGIGRNKILDKIELVIIVNQII
jgi:hypothetical protein